MVPIQLNLTSRFGRWEASYPDAQGTYWYLYGWSHNRTRRRAIAAWEACQAGKEPVGTHY